MASNEAPPVYETEVIMISRMREILPPAFPCLRNRNKWSHPWGVSGPQPNPSRGGHYGAKKGGKLLKAKATDIYLDADKSYEKRLGDLLFDGLLRYRRQLGIVFIIWDRQKSTPRGNSRSYPRPPKACPTGPPWRRKSCLHRNHLHVEFDRTEGDKDHSAILRKIVAEVKLALSKGGP